MTREIKFRAWGIDGNEGPKMWPWKYIREVLYMWMDESSSVVMQYTGLKDKNGKEIYEGDIVIRRAYEYPNDPREKLIETVHGVVVWSSYSSGFAIDTEPNNEEGSQDDYEYLDGSNTILEVVGNIYENPKLLHMSEMR